MTVHDDDDDDDDDADDDDDSVLPCCSVMNATMICLVRSCIFSCNALPQAHLPVHLLFLRHFIMKPT